MSQLKVHEIVPPSSGEAVEILKFRFLEKLLGGVTYRKDWVSGESYNEKDVVIYGDLIYRANVNHTAGETFTLANWDLLDVSISVAGATPGEYTKVTVNELGKVVSGALLTPSDLPAVPAEKITGVVDPDNLGIGTPSNNLFLRGDGVWASPTALIGTVTETQIATAGQTLITLVDYTYIPGSNSIAVYLNGIRLESGVDYTESSNTTLMMVEALSSGDKVVIVRSENYTNLVDPTIRAQLAASDGASLVGFQQAGTGAIVRVAQDKLRERVSVKDFGAVGDGVADDTTAIQAALDVHKRVHVPAGRYLVSATIRIPNKALLEGDGVASEIYGDNVVGPLLEIGGAIGTNGATARDLALNGAATTAMSVKNAQNCVAKNIRLVGGTFTDGFVFDYVWPGNFQSLHCNGAVITNACFVFKDEVNACAFSDLYTSNFSEYNFLIDGSGHGNTITGLAAQGGRFGFFVKRHGGGFGGWTVSGLYTENTPRPIVFGNRGAPLAPGFGQAQGWVFNGAMLAGPQPSHPFYSECISAIELNSCTGVVFNGTHFLSTYRTSGGFPTVAITGDGTGAFAVARVKPTGEIHSIEVLTPGTGYTNAVAEISGGGGTGAALSVTLAGGAVGGITVTAAGSGYKRLQTPMAVTFDMAQSVTFVGSRHGGVTLGDNAPLYPYVCKYSGAFKGFTSTITIDDVSLRNGSVGGSARVMKCSGGGNTKFAVSEYTSDGTHSVYVYTAPSFP